MKSKFFKVIIRYAVPIVGIIFGLIETAGGVRDLIDVIHESPEETTEEKVEESV